MTLATSSAGTSTLSLCAGGRIWTVGGVVFPRPRTPAVLTRRYQKQGSYSSAAPQIL